MLADKHAMRGTVIFFYPDRHFGKILPDSGGEPAFFHISNIISPDRDIQAGDHVEFELSQNEKGLVAQRIQLLIKPPQLSVVGQPSDASLVKNCFVVMPYGRNSEEVRWFSGWYSLVIEEAVRSAGFQPILAAAQQSPDAINDDIRTHLALDPMVVVDLGGMTPQDAPNANVMYELGIRHAFNLPHVIMAWEGQRLPFDISNQRVIMERRDMTAVAVNRERLARFIKEAENGNHYRPMDAVGRVATLDLAERRLGPDSVLGALVEEVRGLRSRFAFHRTEKQVATIKIMLGNKAKRSTARQQFLASGGTEAQWGKLLVQKVEPDIVGAFRAAADKGDFLVQLATKYVPGRAKADLAPPAVDVASESASENTAAVTSEMSPESEPPDPQATTNPSLPKLLQPMSEREDS